MDALGAMGSSHAMHTPAFPDGVAACEVEIDPDTGKLNLTRYAAVDDVGRCINPLVVGGQTHSATAQGVGQALWDTSISIPLPAGR
jgi:aerobic carbon-monoxide dehydrogenase large subunit